jgi:hypothetical protein
MPYKASILKCTLFSSTTWIGGITRQQVNPGLDVRTDIMTGSQYASQGFINAVNSRVTFTTKAVAQALGVTGLLGAGFPVTGGVQTVEIYEIKYENDGSIATGAVHRLMRLKAGRILPRRIECSNGEDATMDLEIMAISDGVADALTDGTTPPITLVENVAAPTLTNVNIDNERFALGPARFTSTNLGCLETLSLDFGLDVKTNACNSNPYPIQIDVTSALPTITATTRDTQLFADASFKLQGNSSTNAQTAVYLRKRKERSADFELNATAAHIKFVGQGLVTVQDAFSADGMTNGTAQIQLNALWDGTNAPLVISTGSAIT